jgi:hypothetical protein
MFSFSALRSSGLRIYHFGVVELVAGHYRPSEPYKGPYTCKPLKKASSCESYTHDTDRVSSSIQVQYHSESDQSVVTSTVLHRR